MIGLIFFVTCIPRSCVRRCITEVLRAGAFKTRTSTESLNLGWVVRGVLWAVT